VNGDVETSVAIPRGAVQIYAAEDIDAASAERRRQEKREQLRGEIARAEGKLANEQFCEQGAAGRGAGRARQAWPSSKPSWRSLSG